MNQDLASRPIVVVDTNVFLSAFGTPRGATAQQLGRIFSLAEVIYSADTMAEFSEKLHSKWLRARHHPLVCSAFGMLCRAEMTPVQVSASINASKDKSDNKFLDLAVTARADMIISGDRDLLQLKTYKGIGHIIPIVRPTAFEQFLCNGGRGIEPRKSRVSDFLAQQSKLRDM